MYRRKFIFILAGLMLLAPLLLGASIINDLPLEKGSYGDSVALVQQRLVDLGYLHFRATRTYGDMTRSAVSQFQRRNNLAQTGIIDEGTYQILFSKDAVRAAGSSVVSRVSGPRTVANPPKYGELTPWETVDERFPVGSTAVITDLYSGNSFTVSRTGGVNHAKVTSASAADHSGYLTSFGGTYTWEKRPVLVEVDGALYAASLFGMPDGGFTGSVDKAENMRGSVSLYFFESASDIGGIEDVEHTTNVYLASSETGTAK